MLATTVKAFSIGTAVVVAGGAAIAYEVKKSEDEYKKRRKGPCPDVKLNYTDEIELYHNSDSYCSQVTRACLEEAEIEWKSHHVELHPRGDNPEVQMVDGYKLQHIVPEFRKINPWCTVPVLVHNGMPVYESKMITRYIAEKLCPRLVPADEKQLNMMDYWINQAYLSGIGVKTIGQLIPFVTQTHFFEQVKFVKFRTIAHAFWNHPLRLRAYFQLLLWIAVNIFGKRAIQFKRANEIIENELDMMEEHFVKVYPESPKQYFLAGGDSISLADLMWMAVWPRLESGGFAYIFQGKEATIKRPRVVQYVTMIKQTRGFVLGIEGTSSMGRDTGLQSMGDPWRSEAWVAQRLQDFNTISNSKI